MVRRVTPRVLVLGVGNGRNIPPLLGSGAGVDALDDDASRIASVSQRFAGESGLRFATGAYDAPLPFEEAYDGALSTHALLHGNRGVVRAALDNARAALRDGAPLHLVLGSTSDPRYGRGRDLGDGTFAPEAGAEAGVPHVYFSEADVREILGGFEIVSLQEGSAAQTAGAWAHEARDAERIVHWFVRARKSAP